MEWLTNNTLITILTIISIIQISAITIAIIASIISWCKGFWPVAYRLGKSLSTGKIAIFSASEGNALCNILTDSNLFNERNIKIISHSEIEKAATFNVFLVHWSDFKDDFDRILSIKKDGTALVIFAPQGQGFLDEDAVKKISCLRNVTLTNMRGRLLNDVLTSSITSNYGK